MDQYGLIGFPLKNSFSADYFTEKFKRLGLQGFVYSNFPLADPSGLPDLIRSNPGLRGLNVTIPHKQRIMPQLDHISDEARAAGAVNCIRIIRQDNAEKPYLLYGYNTDVYGFEHSLLPLLPETPRISKALILGTGGAAKAVAFVLGKLGISFLYVSRTPQQQGILSYDQLDARLMQEHRLIVNCTPAGMFPDTDHLPAIPYTFLTGQHLCYDLIYLPEVTAFMRQSAAQGARIKNGLEMLHLQADKAWEIWSAAGDQ